VTPEILDPQVQEAPALLGRLVVAQAIPDPLEIPEIPGILGLLVHLVVERATQAILVPQDQLVPQETPEIPDQLVS
jgi:hypothetical protein